MAAGHAKIQATAKFLAVLGAAHAPARSCSVVRGGRREVEVEPKILHVTESKTADTRHANELQQQHRAAQSNKVRVMYARARV